MYSRNTWNALLPGGFYNRTARENKSGIEEGRFRVTPDKFSRRAWSRLAFGKTSGECQAAAGECDRNHKVDARRTGAAGFRSRPSSIAEPLNRS